MTTTLSGRRQDLDEAAGDREEVLRAAGADSELADAERRHERGVVWQHPQLALGAGQRDAVHGLVEDEPFRRDDLELDRHRSLTLLALESLGVGADVVDRAGKEERLLRQRVRLALEDVLE
jgi:hypothetical protein